jgi:redox-sensitive bicupin YhaK (pirin superfamily)
MDIPAEDTIFFYIVRGNIRLNNRSIGYRNLVEFDYQEGKLSFDAIEDSYILLGHCKPLDEPVVSQDPFVMNTEEEIYQAYSDYQRGLFGRWNF